MFQEVHLGYLNQKSNQLIVEDHLNYENGLPQLDAKAYNEGKNKWYLNDGVVALNKEKNSFNLFKKVIIKLP